MRLGLCLCTVFPALSIISKMTDRELAFFDMCVASILSFQFHPANHLAGVGPIDDEIDKAIDVAFRAVVARREFLRKE